MSCISPQEMMAPMNTKPVTGTVLVVEDSASAREIVVRILQREGYTVQGVSSAREALESIDEHRPDLVLLDMMMPEMDGMDLLRTLRSRPETRDVPVIFLSALSDDERMRKAAELGAQGYLVKTRVSYEELLDQVSRYVPHS